MLALGPKASSSMPSLRTFDALCFPEVLARALATAWLYLSEGVLPLSLLSVWVLKALACMSIYPASANNSQPHTFDLIATGRQCLYPDRRMLTKICASRIIAGNTAWDSNYHRGTYTEYSSSRMQEWCLTGPWSDFFSAASSCRARSFSSLRFCSASVPADCLSASLT